MAALAAEAGAPPPGAPLGRVAAQLRDDAQREAVALTTLSKRARGSSDEDEAPPEPTYADIDVDLNLSDATESEHGEAAARRTLAEQLRGLLEHFDEWADFNSARGHIRLVTVLMFALLLGAGAMMITVEVRELTFFSEAAAVVLAYAAVGWAVSCCGCASVTLRLTRLLLAFASCATLMAVLFGTLAMITTAVALAAIGTAARYELGAGYISVLSVGLALLSCALVGLWSLAAHDARVTRLNMLLRGIPGTGELPRAPNRARAWWRRRRRRPAQEAAAAAKGAGADDDDEDEAEALADAQQRRARAGRRARAQAREARRGSEAAGLRPADGADADDADARADDEGDGAAIARRAKRSAGGVPAAGSAGARRTRGGGGNESQSWSGGSVLRRVQGTAANVLTRLGSTRMARAESNVATRRDSTRAERERDSPAAAAAARANGYADALDDEEAPKFVPRVEELDEQEQRSRTRARWLLLLVGLPAFGFGLALIYPLLFSETQQVDRELVLIGHRSEMADFYVAWEGAMGALVPDEDHRPVARVLASGERAHGARRFRGVPFLKSLRLLRDAGVLSAPFSAPKQLVLMVTSRAHAPAPPPPPWPPAPDAGAGCDDTEPTPWCEARRERRCGRPLFDARCLRTCGRCEPSPPPAPPPPRPPPPLPPTRPDGSRALGAPVALAGDSAEDCLNALFGERVTTVFGQVRTRLALLGLAAADVAGTASRRTRGAQPAGGTPRSVALSDFELVCYEGELLSARSFWADARAQLGAAALEQPCATQAGVVGGMGPFAGSLYFQSLTEGLQAHAQGLRSNNESARADAADASCVEVYSNPQLEVNRSQLLRSIGSTERHLLEIASFLGRPPFRSYAGPSNTWYELSYRTLTAEQSRDSAGNVRLINMIAAVVERALQVSPQGGSYGIIATAATLANIEQRERLDPARANMYRLNWEERNAKLAAISRGEHAYVELVPPRGLRNGQYLGRQEARGIEYVKEGDIDKAREAFAQVYLGFGLEGIKHVIAACTEVAVAFTRSEVAEQFNITMHDSSALLAEEQLERIADAIDDVAEADED